MHIFLLLFFQTLYFYAFTFQSASMDLLSELPQLPEALSIFSAWSFSFRNFISGVYEWVNIFSRIVCYVLRLFLKCAVQKRRVFFTKQCVPFPVCTFWIFLQRYCAMCRCAIMCAYWSDNGHIWLSGPNLGILDPKLPSQTLYLGWHLNGYVRNLPM